MRCFCANDPALVSSMHLILPLNCSFLVDLLLLSSAVDPSYPNSGLAPSFSILFCLVLFWYIFLFLGLYDSP